MALRSGDEVVVEFRGNWVSGIFLARMKSNEYQVQLESGNTVHVHPKQVFQKGKKKK